MGATASVPATVDEATARRLAGGAWNDEWTSILASAGGAVPQREALLLWTMGAPPPAAKPAATAAPAATEEDWEARARAAEAEVLRLRERPATERRWS